MIGDDATSGFKGTFFISPYRTPNNLAPASDLEAMLGPGNNDLSDFFAGSLGTAVNVYTDQLALNYPTGLLLSASDNPLAEVDEYIELGCTTSFDLTRNENAQELTCFNQREKRYVAGQPEYELSIEVIADVRARVATVGGVANTVVQNPGQGLLLASWTRGDKFKWYYIPDDDETSPAMVAGVALFDSFNWNTEADGFNQFSIDAKVFAIIQGQTVGAPVVGS